MTWHFSSDSREPLRPITTDRTAKQFAIAAVAAALAAALVWPAHAGHILSATDEDAICRVMYAEAAREPLLGKLAVIEVIRRRMGDNLSASDVVNARG
jgi:hypothetical protein